MRACAIDVALCRHEQERERGGGVLTVLGAPEFGAADFARWASVQGTPVVPVGAGSLEQAAGALLTGLPHRTLRDPARWMLVEKVRRTAEDLTGGLAARTPRERRQWLLELMLATQSPGDLDYRSREQINTWMVGRVTERRSIEKVEPLFERKPSAAAKLGDLRPGQFPVAQDATIAEIERTPSLLITEPVPEAEIQLAASQAGAVTNEPCPACVRT